MNQPTLLHSRILIVGSSGSGKTTLAKRLSEKTRIESIPTDEIYWTKFWELRSDDDVISRINFDRETWIIDGNFDSRWKEIWPKADLVIWLNLSIHKVFFRVLFRNLSWALTTSDWNGEKMPWDIAFQGISHSLRSHMKKRDFYPSRVPHLGDTSLVECNSDEDIEELIKMF